MAKEFFEALDALSQENGITSDELLAKIKQGIEKAVRKEMPGCQAVRVDSTKDGKIQVKVLKTVVAEVTEEPRLVMRWNGKVIVDISREFLNSNGAEKHIDIAPAKVEDYNKEIPVDFESGIKAICDDINTCSKRGLSERFDSTIGANTVLMPFGGKNQLTPPQAMAHKISVDTRKRTSKKGNFCFILRARSSSGSSGRWTLTIALLI